MQVIHAAATVFKRMRYIISLPFNFNYHRLWPHHIVRVIERFHCARMARRGRPRCLVLRKVNVVNSNKETNQLHMVRCVCHLVEMGKLRVWEEIDKRPERF